VVTPTVRIVPPMNGGRVLVSPSSTGSDDLAATIATDGWGAYRPFVLVRMRAHAGSVEHTHEPRVSTWKS
jgi:hypothetical protein